MSDQARFGRSASLSLQRVWPVGVAVLLLLVVNLGVLVARAPSQAQPLSQQPTAQGVSLPAEGVQAEAATAPETPEAGPEVAEELPGTETDEEPLPPPPEDPSAEGLIDLVTPEPRLSAYSGLSTWVDLHDTQLTPEQQARRAAAGGVDTIFVQTARFNSPTDIHDPNRLSRLIETAHDLDMKVMTWYIPDFVDPERDLRRSKAAIAFETPRGDRADAFGLDIEVEAVRDAAERTQRLLWISHKLREAVGPDYPLSAIVLPPLQLDLRPSWWPGFPFDKLTTYYDVFIPMSYSSYRGTDPQTTFSWNFANIVETRDRAGDPNLPIHMAGGIADNLPHVEQFVRALEEGKVMGGGLYDLHTTPPQSWGPLQAVRDR